MLRLYVLTQLSFQGDSVIVRKLAEEGKICNVFQAAFPHTGRARVAGTVTWRQPVQLRLTVSAPMAARMKASQLISVPLLIQLQNGAHDAC